MSVRKTCLNKKIKKPKVRPNLKSQIYTNKTLGNTLPTSGDNVSVNNPFDDPVGTTSRPSYQQGGVPYAPVTRPAGTNEHTICRVSVVRCKILLSFLPFSLSFSIVFNSKKIKKKFTLCFVSHFLHETKHSDRFFFSSFIA